MNIVRDYDHRSHVGNAGDVWKHFILAEAANCLLATGSCLIYAESHVGRPEYLLDSRGEWTEGVGRCWPRLPALQDFSYFKILADLNPYGPARYPGSACLILNLARSQGANLSADVWDIDPAVAKDWTAKSKAKRTAKQTAKLLQAGQGDKIEFHLGDGFSGVKSLLKRSQPGLLLIDPPYLNPTDAQRAEDLLFEAEENGWAVLWWYMAGAKTVPESSRMERLSLSFADAGMDCGRWKGAVVALAGFSRQAKDRLKESIRRFLEIMSPAESL